MNIVQNIKENPVISVLTGFILVMSTITGTLTATGQLDSLFLTESEFADIFAEHESKLHPGADQAIDDLKTWNRCDRLERKIATLEDRLWRAQQTPDTDPQTIRDIERDIATTERQFEALNCAEVLIG